MKSLAYHPHLVSMLGFVADRKSPYLLVEFCEHGDLLHMIRSRRQEIIEVVNFAEQKKILFLGTYCKSRRFENQRPIDVLMADQ